MASWRAPGSILEASGSILEAPGCDFGEPGVYFWSLCGYLGHAKWEKHFLPLVSFMGITQVQLRKPKSGQSLAKV